MRLTLLTALASACAPAAATRRCVDAPSAAGIGVRESSSGITGNLSPFVPHLFG
jgi:hypothetical protein